MTFNNNTKSSERDFFSGEYQFTGKHGEYVKQLTDTLVEKGTYEKEIKIFAFNHKIYTVAPMIGYLYNVRQQEKCRIMGLKFQKVKLLDMQIERRR